MKNFVLFAVLSMFLAVPNFKQAYADASGPVISAFQQNPTVGAKEADGDKWKHEILFIMGVVLLVLIFLTSSMGVAMAMYGKQVFVVHMVSAGLTVFLAVAHAVTSIVWFFPFK
jgi:hypothetical protein